jgi:hypothetical protein
MTGRLLALNSSNRGYTLSLATKGFSSLYDPLNGGPLLGCLGGTTVVLRRSVPAEGALGNLEGENG